MLAPCGVPHGIHDDLEVSRIRPPIRSACPKARSNRWHAAWTLGPEYGPAARRAPAARCVETSSRGARLRVYRPAWTGRSASSGTIPWHGLRVARAVMGVDETEIRIYYRAFIEFSF